MEYHGEQWNAARKRWEPGPAEYAGGTWRRVLTDRAEPVPLRLPRPGRWPAGPLDTGGKARHMAAWIARTKAPAVTVFAGAGTTPAMHRFNHELCRELSRLGWSGEMRLASPADYNGPTPDTGNDAVIREGSACHA